MIYRVFLVSISSFSLLIWTVTIKIFGIVFELCLLRFINELYDDGPQERPLASNRYTAFHRLFVFLWNGFT